MYNFVVYGFVILYVDGFCDFIVNFEKFIEVVDYFGEGVMLCFEEDFLLVL